MRILDPGVLIRVVFYGGLIALAATVWAWAVGTNVLYGVVPGVVLGLGGGIFLGLAFKNAYEDDPWGGMPTFLAGSIVFGFLLVLSIVGAIVGIIRLAFLTR